MSYSKTDKSLKEVFYGTYWNFEVHSSQGLNNADSLTLEHVQSFILLQRKFSLYQKTFVITILYVVFVYLKGLKVKSESDMKQRHIAILCLQLSWTFEKKKEGRVVASNWRKLNK
jgi:hypothetical protein